MYSSGACDSTNQSSYKPILLIGVCGGDFSGKTTISQKLIEILGPSYNDKVVCISEEIFRRNSSVGWKNSCNPEHPGGINEKAMEKALLDVVNKRNMELETFNCGTNKLYQADIVLVEGRFIFSFPGVRKLFGIKIFVDVPCDIRLGRRILNDKQDANQTFLYYSEFVKPVIEEFCLPTKEYADIIIPWEAERKGAIDLLYTSILQVIQNRHSELIQEMADRNRSLYYGS